jgi:glycosyltransferase involved in cell wall biosynthesis
MGVLPLIKRACVPLGLRLGTFAAYPPRPISPIPSEPEPPKGELPLVSIVTPSYNQGAFLEHAIDSVATQDYPNTEHIVIDGGSTDDSLEILERRASDLAHWVSEPDQGQTHAITKGFGRAQGSILAWLNADDALLPGAVSAAVHALTRGRDVVYGHRIVIDEHNNEVGRWVLPKHRASGLLWRDYVPQETMFWTRELHETVGGLDERFQFAMDWDLVVRFHRAGARFERLDRFMGCFRTHAAQKSLAQRVQVGEPEFAQIRQGMGTRENLGSLAYLAASVPAYWRFKLGRAGRG